jgi:hypothetical protein
MREIVGRQARDPATRVSVVLLSGTGASDPGALGLPGEVHRLAGESPPAEVSPAPALTYADLLDLIFAADSVVSW